MSDLRTTPGTLDQVGHSPLLNRGMNAALAVKGDYAYVGNRTDGTHLNPGVLVIDVSDPSSPEVVGEIGPPLEGNPGESSRELRIWRQQSLLMVLNHGCSELISTEDLRRPRRLAEFVPQPLPAVQTEDPAVSSGRDKVVMWSYPIVQDGLIYLVDVRDGLYILRYRGPCQEEISSEGFLERNSNLGDALRFERSATGRDYAGRCASGNAAQEPASDAGARGAAAADPPAFPSAAFESGELSRD